MSLTATMFFNKWIGAVHLAAIGSAGVKNSFKVLDLEVDRWKSGKVASIFCSVAPVRTGALTD